jgi:hypothetical protein
MKLIIIEVIERLKFKDEKEKSLEVQFIQLELIKEKN